MKKYTIFSYNRILPIVCSTYCLQYIFLYSPSLQNIKMSLFHEILHKIRSRYIQVFSVRYVIRNVHNNPRNYVGVARQGLLSKSKENNSIYIRVEFRKSLGRNFISPFQTERELKVCNSCKCSQIICSRVH